MKKNKAMRTAGGLFIATMLTTSIVSGTYAKYVTKGGAQDEARVAAFGVYVKGSGNLFDKTYWGTKGSDGNGTNANKPAKTATGETITVKSLATYGDGNVVAPGTNNDTGVTISLEGTPEVDVKITYDFDTTKLEDIFLKVPMEGGTYPDLTDANAKTGFTFAEDYHPLVFTLKGNVLDKNKGSNGKIGGLDVTGSGANASVSGSLKQISDVFAALNNAAGTTVKAGTDLSANNSYGLQLTWKWDFEKNDAATMDSLKKAAEAVGASDTEKNAYQAALAENTLRDQQDTLLGDFAAIAFKGATQVTSGASKPVNKVKLSDLAKEGYGILGKRKVNTAETGTDGFYCFDVSTDQQAIVKGTFGRKEDFGNVSPTLEIPVDYTKYSDVNNQYWLNVSVDFSVTVTQVD